MEKSLPKGWVESNIRTISEIIRGVSYKKNEASSSYSEHSIYILRGGNIQDGRIDFETDDNVYVKSHLVNPKQYIQKDDVVIVGSTGSKKLIGKAGIAGDKLANVSFGAFLMLLRTYTVNSKYHSYFFQTAYYRNTISELAGGVNINNIRKEHLENLKFPLPPLAEQERIVAKLDKLFAQHEKIKKALDRIPQLLEAFRQKVLTQAVTGKLTEKWREGKDLEDAELFIEQVISDRNEHDRTLKRKIVFESIAGSYEIPPKWSFSFLQNLGQFTRGKSKDRPRNDKKLFNGSYPFIQTGDVSNSKMYINEYKNTYSEFGLRQSRLFPKGTLCVTIAANIAETAILNFDSCFPDSVVGYIPYKNLYSSEFAMYFINTIRKQLEHFAPATAQKNINMAILTEIPFPVPPLQEQQEIVRRVESLFAKADTIEERYQALKAKIARLPQAILHKAFKGELVPQLPTDGDAKDLLAEIVALKKEVKERK